MSASIEAARAAVERLDVEIADTEARAITLLERRADAEARRETARRALGDVVANDGDTKAADKALADISREIEGIQAGLQALEARRATANRERIMSSAKVGHALAAEAAEAVDTLLPDVYAALAEAARLLVRCQQLRAPCDDDDARRRLYQLQMDALGEAAPWPMPRLPMPALDVWRFSDTVTGSVRRFEEARGATERLGIAERLLKTITG